MSPETVAQLLSDASHLAHVAGPAVDAIIAFLDEHPIRYTTWPG
jgi:hypothetical protein